MNYTAFYEIRGRHFISALDANIDKTNALSDSAREVARLLGFSESQARLEVPYGTHMLKWGGIFMEPEEFEKRTDLHGFWKAPNENNHIYPDRDKAPELAEYYQELVADLYVPITACRDCRMPSDPANFPCILMFKGAHYFMMYPEPVEELPIGIVRVSEDYVQDAMTSELPRNFPNEQY